MPVEPHRESPPSAPPHEGQAIHLSAAALIVANLFPLAGVLFLGWNLANVLLLYWAESAVIGIISLLRMLYLGGWRAIPLVLFFCVHFGGFMAVHLLFLYALTEAVDWKQATWSGSSFHAPSRPDAPFLPTASFFGQIPWFALAALAVSHGVSFHRHFLLGPESEADDSKEALGREMNRPYGRVVVMHIAIIAGAFLVAALQQPVGLLIVLVLLKAGVDLVAHLREHRGRRKPATDPSQPYPTRPA